MTRRLATPLRPGRVPRCLMALLLVGLAATAPLLASTARDLYTAALTRERDLRVPADEPPTLTQLQDAMAAYIDIVRQYPRSGYSDNALWQAAGLAIRAFDRNRRPADREAGARWLHMLEREYPSSSLVPRVGDRLEQLRRLDELVRIRAIGREPLADVVRVTIELDGEARYNAERLDGPPRLFFDFSGTDTPSTLRNATLAFDDGDLVREIRLGRHPGQTTRVVLDIEDVDSYSVYALYDPYRLIVDAVPSAAMQARRATPGAPTSPAVAGHTGAPPTDPVGALSPVATADVSGAMAPVAPIDSLGAPAPDDGTRRRDGLPVASSEPVVTDPPPSDPTPRHTSGLDVLSVPTTWEVRRLDPIPPAVTPDIPDLADLVDAEPEPSPHEPTAGPAPAALSVSELTSPPAPAPDVSPQPGVELAWPRVHDILYPDLGAPPSVETVGDDSASERTDPADELVSATPSLTRDVVVPGTRAVPMSTVEVLPPLRVDPTAQIVHQGPAPPPPAVADVAVESFGDREERAGTGTPTANSDGDFSLGRQLGLGVSRVVIDPGHGGYDPGAQTGTLTESALVLDVARRLEARLRAETGIEIVLTRQRDAYVPLRARTELANRVGADLFLSIHANAATDPRARGVETYHLNLATDPNAQSVAARENAASREGMHDLAQLVRSITMRNKRDESQDFAAMVQRNLIGAVRQVHPSVQDLGVKQAPFVVLIGANMPSVLAEISFLTNQEDAAFLATDAYRDLIADALLQSIIEYQRTLKPSTNLTAKSNE